MDITAETFKFLIDSFYAGMPSTKKKKLYDEYLLGVDKRNNFKKQMLQEKNGKKVGNIYNEKVLKIEDALKAKIALLLLGSKYKYLVSGGLTLDETGQVFSITREGIRQIEARGLEVLKNPYVLKKANNSGTIDTIMELKNK